MKKKLLQIITLSLLTVLFCTDPSPTTELSENSVESSLLNMTPESFSRYLRTVGRWKPTIESDIGNQLIFDETEAYLDIMAPKKRYIAKYEADVGSVEIRTFKSIHYRAHSVDPEKATFHCRIGFRDHRFLERIYLECKITSEQCTSKDDSFECYYASHFRVYDPNSASQAPNQIQFDGYNLINEGLQTRKVKQDAFLRAGPGLQFEALQPILCPEVDDKYPKGAPFIVIGRTIEKGNAIGKSDYWYYGYSYEHDCDLPTQRKAWIFGSLLE